MSVSSLWRRAKGKRAHTSKRRRAWVVGQFVVSAADIDSHQNWPKTAKIVGTRDADEAMAAAVAQARQSSKDSKLPLGTLDVWLRLLWQEQHHQQCCLLNDVSPAVIRLLLIASDPAGRTNAADWRSATLKFVQEAIREHLPAHVAAGVVVHVDFADALARNVMSVVRYEVLREKKTTDKKNKKKQQTYVDGWVPFTTAMARHLIGHRGSVLLSVGGARSVSFLFSLLLLG